MAGSKALLSLSLPLVGRVACCERSEQHVGWGLLLQNEIFRALPCATPPGASRHPPHKGEGLGPLSCSFRRTSAVRPTPSSRPLTASSGAVRPARSRSGWP